MNTSIRIPERINVGYQTRKDTYTQKLAYVIYYDEKGVLRKEKSWQGWRDKSINPEEFKNEPTSGFVLNKKVGGYKSDWNHRQTYVRVYDPRGFEFEITVPNLLYILENTSSIIGKGLEGEFVYGWDGTDLVLLPASAPEYEELMNFNKTVSELKKFKGTDMIVGATYQTKQNYTLIYLGRFDYFETTSYDDITPVCKGKKYFFALAQPNAYNRFEEITSLTSKIISCVSEECHAKYADYMDLLEKQYMYSPYDSTLDVKVPATLDNLKYVMGNKSYNKDNKYHHNFRFSFEGDDYYIECPDHRDYKELTLDDNHHIFKVYNESEWERNRSQRYYYSYRDRKPAFEGSLQQIIDKYGIINRKTFLKNGNPYKHFIGRHDYVEK